MPKKAIFLLLLNTFLMFNCALAFPTVRQVMNFDIGDMFHYRVVTGLSGPYLHQTYYIESQELIGKQYNLDSTNVTYQFKRISYQGASENGVWCNMTTDTLSQTYTNLDSSCTSLYANYCTQNSLSLDVSTFTFSEETNSIYQGRTLADGKKDNNNYVTCVVGLGFVAHKAVGNTRQLVWYKKGNETYGTAIAYLNSPYTTYYHKVSGNTTCGNYFNFALPDTIPPTVPTTPTALIAYYIPNDNAIKVQIPENEGTSVIEIINFQGQRIYQIEVAPKQTEISIAAQTLESQIYIVRLLTGEKQSYQKISVIK